MNRRFKMKTRRKIKQFVAATMAVIMLTPSDIANIFGSNVAHVKATTISESAIDSAEIPTRSEADNEIADGVSVSVNDAGVTEVSVEPSETDVKKAARRSVSAELETVWNGYVVNEEYASWNAGDVLLNVNSFRYIKPFDGLTVTGYTTLSNGSFISLILSPDKDGASFEMNKQVNPYKSSVEYLGKTWYVGDYSLMHMSGDVTSKEGKAYKLTGSYDTAEQAALALLEQVILPVEIALPTENLEATISNTDQGEILLSWPIVEEAASYEIYRDQLRIKTVNADETEDGESLLWYQDNMTDPGNTYAYKVFALDAEGNVISAGEELEGSIAPELILTADYTLNQDMTVYSVEVKGGTLNLNGHVLTVQNDYLQSSGQLNINAGSLVVGQNMTLVRSALNMMDSADYVCVNGTFSYQGYSSILTDGILECKGDFLVENNGTFWAKEYHKVILSGEEAQKLSLNNASYLAGLSVKNTSEIGVYAEEGFPVASFEKEEDAKLTISGLSGEIGTKLEEDLTVESDYYLLGGQLDLNGHTLHVTGDFYQLSGEVFLDEGALTVDGDFLAAVPVYDEDGVRTLRRSGGVLTMLSEKDVLSVKSDTIIMSCTDGTGRLTNGRMELGGDLIIDTTYQDKVFAPTKDHMLVLNGEEGQKIQFTKSSLNSSYIQNLAILNNSEEGITFENGEWDEQKWPLIAGKITFDQPIINGMPAFYATTTCDGVYPGDVVNTENCLYRNDLAIAGDLHVLNTMTVEGTLSIGGDLILHSTKSYNYPLYFYINGAGYVKAEGNVEVPVNAMLSANSGTLEIGKDLSVAQRMQFAGKHKTIFSGKEKQIISVPEGCCFAIVELRNTSEEGVYSTTVFKRNELIRNDSILHYGDMQGEFGWTLEKDEIYEGDLILLDDVLDLNGHQLTVNGDLIQSAGEIKLSEGSLVVKGDYRMQSPEENGKYAKSSGILTMDDDKDHLVVEGDLIVDAISNSTGHLNAGTISLYGDMAVYGDHTCTAFVSTDSHKMVLCGDKAQTLTIPTVARKCTIANLEVANMSEEGVTFGTLVDNAYTDSPYVSSMVTLPETDPVIKGCLAISGSTEFSKPYPGNVSIFDRTDLLKDLHILGNLYSGYMVRIGHATIQIDGDLVLDNTNRYAYEYLTFQYADSVVDVAGNVILDGYTYMDGANGCLMIGGDLLGASDVRFTKNHKTIFDGNSLQTIDTTEKSYFAIVELLNDSADGVYSKRVFKRDQLIRHNTRLSYEGQEGEFGWTLEEDEVYEGDLILLDDVLDLNGHTLTVNGNLIQTAGEVRLSGGTLKVTKDYRGNGFLTMTNDNDTLIVEENLIITTPSDTTGYLTAGKLYVKGNVCVDNPKNASANANKSFMASDDHTLILNGDKRQEIFVATPGSTTSVIANLTIENKSEEGVVFDNSQNTYPLVNGVISLADESKITGTLAMGSNTSFEKPYPENVFVNEKIVLTKDNEILGNITCKSTIDLRATLVVGGDFTVCSDNYYATNWINFLTDDARLEVAGNMNVENGSTLYGNTGTCTVGKDLTVRGTIAFLSNHKLILNGQGGQSVSLANDNSYFATIELQNQSAEGVSFDRKPVCDKLLRNGCVISFPNDAWTYGYTLEEDETHESMILFDDTLDLNGHTLTIEGDLVQAGGEVKVNHGTLKVLGDYRIQTLNQNGSYGTSLGVLIMGHEDDKVSVSGDFVIQTKVSEETYLTGGSLEVKGNITQLGNVALGTSKGHTLILSGDKTQSLSGTREFAMANVINRNAVKVNCDTNIRLNGTFTDEGNSITSDAYLIVQNTDQVLGGRYSGNLMVMEDSKLETDLAVAGKLEVQGALDLNGHKLTAEGIHATNNITVSSGILTCVEDMTLDGYGMLIMQNEADYVLVGGDLYFNTYADHEGYLTAGTLELRGDFKQDKAANFKATENHTTILSRKRTVAGKDRIATIRFGYYENGCGFATLVLKKAKDQYRFTPDCDQVAAKVVLSPDDTQDPTTLDYLVADIVTENSVRLSFGGATDNVGIQGYAIYRDGKLIANTSSNTYTDRKVHPSTEYVYRVYAFDNDQNMAEESPECRVTTKEDTTAPTKPSNLAVKTRTGSSITLTWNPSKDNVKVAGYNVYQEEECIAELVNATEYKVNKLDKNVAYHFHVEAVDENGNVSEAGEVLETSTVMPKITEITPGENATIGGNTVKIEIAFKDAGNSTGNTVNVELKNAAGTWDALTKTPLNQEKNPKGGLDTSFDWDISALNEEKEYRLKITLKDADGNTDTKEIGYYIDREAPKTPTNVKADGSDGNVFVTWEPSVSADAASYKIYRKMDEKEAYELIDEIEGRYENGIVDKKVEVGASYYYAVSAVDAFGNESEKAESTMITVGVDEKAPVVKGVTPNAGRINGTTQIDVTATDNKKLSKIGIQYKAVDTEEWTDIEEKESIGKDSLSGTISFSWDTSKVADGVYYLNAYAIDAAGNRSEEEYTRRYEIDNTGIAKVVITKTDAGSSFVRLDWEDVKESDFAYFSVEQKKDTTFEQVDTVKDRLGAYIKNLKPDTEYTFIVVGYDNLGNRGIASDEVTIKTESDTTAPYITELYPVIAPYSKELKLAVKAGDDVAVDKAIFSYATDGKNFTKIAEVKADSKESAEKEIKLSYDFDLSDIPEGELTIKYEVFDTAGNKNALTKENEEVTTVYTIDKTAPEKIQNLAVGNAEGYVELTWTDATKVDSDIKAFRIYRADGDSGIFTVLSEECTTKNYYDTKVTPGYTYLYKVSALDQAGNEGTCSEQIMVTVEEDSEKPVITGISPANGEKAGANPFVKILSIDKTGLAKVALAYQSQNEQDIWHEIGVQEIEGTCCLTDIEWDTTGLPEGTYKLCAMVTDKAGNMSDPYYSEISLDLTAPIIAAFSAENGHYETSLRIGIERDDFEQFEILRREAGTEFKSIGFTKEKEYHDKKVEVDTLYYYKVIAYDECGNASYSEEVSAYADNQDFEAPIAMLSENVTGYVGMEIALDGTGSMDNAGIVDYIWDMGDGTIIQGKGAQIRHTYQTEGLFTITLTVRDYAGNENSTKSTARIYDKTGTGRIRLQVLDEEGCGMEYALVYMGLPDGDSLSLRTDAEGFIDIIAPVGIYSVAAFNKGYIPNDVDVIFNEYEDKEYTLTLEKKELVVGQLTFRRMTLEEMEEAGVDFSDPRNFYEYTMDIELVFIRRNKKIEYIYENGFESQKQGWVYGQGGEITEGGIYRGKSIQTKKKKQDGDDDKYLYLRTQQSISWLKDIYEVELGVINMADYQYSIEDCVATLNLPEGLSLAITNPRQDLVQEMGTIDGQQQKSVDWIIKGDEKGQYALSADFAGTLMPFEEPVSVHFAAEEELEVKPGDGIKVYIMPEQDLFLNEDYYVQFAIVNESEYPLYGFTTTIGKQETPDYEFSYTDVDTGITETEIVEMEVEDPTCLETALVVSNGQIIRLEVMYPGQAFYGTYKTKVTGSEEDAEKYYYHLIDDLCKIIGTPGYDVECILSPIDSHISRTYYKFVPQPTLFGDPIDVTTGYFTDSMTALSVTGATTLSFDMHYESGNTSKVGDLGCGWYHDYESRLISENGLVHFYLNPNSDILFMHKSATQNQIFGKKEGDKFVVSDDESLTIGEYECLNGKVSNCKLVRNQDYTYTLRMSSGAVYQFDPDGRLISMQDGDGKEVRVEYDEYTTIITDVISGKKLFYEKDPFGYVYKVYDETGRATYLSYDYLGKNLIKITLPNSDEVHYEYDKNGHIISESNEFGTFVTNTYDEDGHVLEQLDADGNLTKCTYRMDDQYMYVTIELPNGGVQQAAIGLDGKIHKMIDANGNVLSYSYDVKGNPVVEKDGNGKAMYKEYNDKGYLVKVTDKGGMVTKMTYDQRGNVTKIVNAAGKEATFTYDANNHLVASTDYSGQRTICKYDENGFLIEQTAEGLGTIKYEYTDGMLTAVTDYLGNVTRSVYDEYGNQIKSIDPLGNVTQMEYDVLGRTTAIIDAYGNRTQYTYNCNGDLISETDAAGNTSRYIYDNAGHNISAEFPDGTIHTYEYDVAGNCIRQNYPDGTFCTAEYDFNGNKIKEVFADGTTMTYTYDAVDDRTSETDGAGNTVYYEHYPNGNLYKIIYPDGQYELYTYNQGWKVSGITDKNGNTTSYGYDDMGRQTSVRDALGNEYTTEYDVLGRVIKETDPNGNSTTYEYDANSNCIKKTDASGTSVHMTYDALNRMTSAYIIDNAGIEHKVSYTYDKLGRMISETDEEGNTSHITYDALGNVKSVTDANGNIESTNIYDNMGRLSQVQDAMGLTTTYQYDKVGNLLKEITKYSSGAQEKAYAYDKLGRVRAVTEDGTITTKADYDNEGNITAITDANGGITSYQYDNCGRVTKEISPLGNATTYTYNAQGLLANVKNANDQNTSYTYDKIGRVVTMTDGTGITSYTYDANGNVLTVEDKNGTIERKYDEMNRVKEYTDYRGNTIKYKYDELGNLIELTYPGGEIVRYTYYKNGWLHTVTDPEGKKTSYTYDGCGRQLTCLRPNNTLEICSYNAAGQLVEQKDVKVYSESEKEELENKIYVATAEGRTYFDEDELLTNYVYTYDEKGNVASVTGTDTVNTKEGISALKSATFEYDAENRLIRYNGEELKYDAEGNMIYGPVNGVMTELTYDCRNRLVSAGNLRYTYDTENNRIAMESFDTKEEYVVDTVSASLSRILVMTSYKKGTNGAFSKSGKTIYTYGSGLISEATGDIVLYHHYNNLGSTMKLTDARGNVAASYTYGTYGELLSGNTTMTRFLYNGRCGVITDDNGLYYMRQRYYNPEIKRFINQDVVTGSITNSQSLNLYSYVQGNPVSYTDPFGLSPLSGLFTDGNFWHGVLGVLGCVPGPVGIVANLVDAGMYFLEGDLGNGLLSVLGAVTLGAGSIAKATKLGANITRAAKYVETASSLISNVASFAKNASGLMENAFNMYDKYVIKKQKFDLSNDETGREIATLGLNVIGTLLSGKGMAKDTKQLSKMMDEDGVLSALSAKISNGARKGACKVGTAILHRPCCFAAGTLVLTEEGYKPIEDVQVGDYVLSKDPETGEEGYKEVLHAFVKESGVLVHLIVVKEDELGNDEFNNDEESINGYDEYDEDLIGKIIKIDTTVTHPFWVQDYGFKYAGELKEGERLLSASGETLIVLSNETELLTTPVNVYNLEVAEWHTYFVSDEDVWVHNDCPKQTGSYVITFKSGKKYVGKGPKSRMEQSAREKSKKYSDPVVSKVWEPADTEADAFVAEYKKLWSIGGPGRSDNYNKIESPGKKILERMMKEKNK